jgi:hypothetical protein
VGFWADLWSFLTAVGTIGMAAATYAIIRQGKQEHADVERHHRDRFRPVCVLLPCDGVDRREGRHELVERVTPPLQPSSFGTVAVKCVLRNIGPGPALRLRVSFRFLDIGGHTTTPHEIAPLAAGEARGGEDAPLLVPVWVYDGAPFNQSSFAAIPNSQWEILLEYEDVFGQRFCAVHHKASVLNAGIPDPYVSGYSKLLPQPWVTFENPEDFILQRGDRNALTSWIGKLRSARALLQARSGRSHDR